MVTRKAVPASATPIPRKPLHNSLPYPTSPVKNSAGSQDEELYSPDLSQSPASELVSIEEARQRTRSDSDASSHGTWNSEGSQEEQDRDTPDEADMPKPLAFRPREESSGEQTAGNLDATQLPASLRVGPTGTSTTAKPFDHHDYGEEATANPWAGHSTAERQQTESNNPYFKQQSENGAVDSQHNQHDLSHPPHPSGIPPPAPSSAPPPPPGFNATHMSPTELPTVNSPTEELQQMSLNGGHRTASWETAEVLDVPQRGQSPFPHPDERPSSTWWQDEDARQEEREESALASPPTPPRKPLVVQQLQDNQYTPPTGPPPGTAAPLVDLESSSTTSQDPATTSSSQPTTSSTTEIASATIAGKLGEQRNKHYQIKHINWQDASDAQDTRRRANIRSSPILTQNANGPCPLLALVNALVLSTPQTLDTALIEVLRTREQVSLGLLLDAVFDELTSGRRGAKGEALPDVSELYSFLLALHTGMNVNPRFVTPVTTPRGSWDGHSEAMSSMHPVHRAQHKAGAFEETAEMRMYSTFHIPLIHGWTAPAETQAYDAFSRTAQTFEDAQNIQFSEADLEEKSRAEGLTSEEQQTLDDIRTIKTFLTTWPTQLTDYGLETISGTMKPGQIAILFRNDHFSTIYKEPQHGALMTLVTDAGYSSHAEIVWESLVDVNGSASEMFSGDFRVVSHNQDVRLNQGNSAGGEGGWQTVQGRNSNSRQGRSANPTPAAPNGLDIASEGTPPPLPGPRPQLIPAINGNPPSYSERQRTASEQEDHDLALALQLQEEEEDHQHQAEQRRQREQQLSEQFLSGESGGEGPRPPIPPRRSGARNSFTPARTAVNRPADDPSDPDAPPSYQQAASDRPYRPAGSTAAASLSQGNPLNTYDALLRRQSAYGQQSSTGLPDEALPLPPYSPSAAQTRRRPEPNRVRRRSSGVPGGPAPAPNPYVPNLSGRRNGHQPGLTGSGFVAPGHTPTSAQASTMRNGFVAPGHTPRSYQASVAHRIAQQRLSQQVAASQAAGQGQAPQAGQAATLKDAEDRCIVM